MKIQNMQERWTWTGRDKNVLLKMGKPNYVYGPCGVSQFQLKTWMVGLIYGVLLYASLILL